MKIISSDFFTFGLDKSTDRVKGKSKGRRPIENDVVSCSPGRSESKVVTVPTLPLSHARTTKLVVSYQIVEYLYSLQIFIHCY